MKTEMKICLPVSKMLCALFFVIILSLVRGVSYTFEIGIAMEPPVAILSIIFCSDTYLMEVQNKREDVFRLYGMKKRAVVVYRRLAIQISYLFVISVSGYWLFYWQKPAAGIGGVSAGFDFFLFFISIPASIFFWGIFSMTICNLIKNMWAGIGITLLFWLIFFSAMGGQFLGKWNVFSFIFRDVGSANDWSWLCGKIVSLIAAGMLTAGAGRIIQ